MDNINVSNGTPLMNTDSGYSKSNSQSRRSDSSASRHFGCNSSGSSGYGGKDSSCQANSNGETAQSKHRELKKKKPKPVASSSATAKSSSDGGISRGSSQDDPSIEEDNSATLSSPSAPEAAQNKTDGFDKVSVGLDGRRLSGDSACCSPSTEKFGDYFFISKRNPATTTTPIQQLPSTVGFTCIVSMGDGVVLYTNSSVSTALGYPADMWLGRSFVDFLHPKDRTVFTSHITSGVALLLSQPASIPKETEGQSSLFCRVRRYHSLRSGLGRSGYGVKDREVCYTPFRFEYSFKDVNEVENSGMYLIISAIPVNCPYSDTNKSLVRFTTRHTSTGIISHVSNEAVGFLGYLPQDIIGRSIFDFYHPEDMIYLKEIYDTIIKKENTQKSKSYRFSAHNGDYLTIEMDWSSFINPWTKKLEFVIGHHLILEGPNNIEVFQNPKFDIKKEFSDDILKQSRMVQEDIMKSLNEVMVKCTEVDKQLVSKKCKELASFMEGFADSGLKLVEELRIDIPDRDSIMFGEISPHHEYGDSKSSTETPPSYNQLNYSENLQRFFKSHPWSTRRSSTPEDMWTDNNQLPDMYTQEYHRKCSSPPRQQIMDSGDSVSSGDFQSKLQHLRPLSHPRRDIPMNTQHIPSIYDEANYKPAHLTQDLLNKHKNHMEKMLIKKHKDARSISRAEEREKVERREKKIESHFDNLPYTSAQFEEQIRLNEHGTKRPGSMIWEHEEPQKVSKNYPDQAPKVYKPIPHIACGNPAVTSADMSSANIYNHNPISTATFVPQAMGINPVGINAMNNPYAGVYPVLIPTTQQGNMAQEKSLLNTAQPNFQIPYLMYPAQYQPIMYSHVPMAPLRMALPTDHMTIPNDVGTLAKPMGLLKDNYIQCQSSTTPKPMTSAKNGETVVIGGYPPVRNQPFKMTESNNARDPNRTGGPCSTNNCPTGRPKNMHNQNLTIGKGQMDGAEKSRSSDDIYDSHSSNSSFYSSFLKTATSNSAEFGDSGGETSRNNSGNKVNYKDDNRMKPNEMMRNIIESTLTPLPPFKSIRMPENKNNFELNRSFRKLHPLWADALRIPSEAALKYQVTAKNIDEVLQSDQNTLDTTEQPEMVNEQLSQLYVEMQLAGLSDNLKLEEGMTSSSSDDDSSKDKKYKREYSKLVMIYEEDAPMPSPDSS